MSWTVAVNTFVAIGVGVPLVLSFFAVPLPARLRIAASMAIGAALVGLCGWPLVKPADPLGAVTLFGDKMNVLEIAATGLLAFLSGAVAYFVCYPYGRQIAPLAGPTGMVVWSIRSGDMTSLLQVNHTLAKRQLLYSAMRWEGFFWLAIAAAGYFGVLAADRLCRAKSDSTSGQNSDNSMMNKALSIVTAAVLTVVITQFAIGVLAQDVRMSDNQVGTVVGQPNVGQIAFAVFISFGLAAFIAKRFLDVSYVYPAIAAAVLTFFTITFFAAKQDILEHMVQTWPVAFFTRATCAILPLQMVAFAVVGSIAGYWVALEYGYRQSHHG
jgi:hypothetical protein